MWTPCDNPSQPPPSSSVPRRAELAPCVCPRRPGPPPPSGNRSRSGQGRGRRRATLASQLRPAWGEVGMAATSRKLSPSLLTATWSDGDLERRRPGATASLAPQRTTTMRRLRRGWSRLAIPCLRPRGHPYLQPPPGASSAGRTWAAGGLEEGGRALPSGPPAVATPSWPGDAVAPPHLVTVDSVELLKDRVKDFG
jgi:hypothetical protein